MSFRFSSPFGYVCAESHVQTVGDRAQLLRLSTRLDRVHTFRAIKHPDKVYRTECKMLS